VITGHARDHHAGITVEVGPGGALQSIRLTNRALRLGRFTLSAKILDLVRTATAHANQRAKNALRDQLTYLDVSELESLGLGHDDRLTESVESTTPDTWRTA
jgi:hypothetical protein